MSISKIFFILGVVSLPIELFPMPWGVAGWNNYSPFLFAASAVALGPKASRSISKFLLCFGLNESRKEAIILVLTLQLYCYYIYSFKLAIVGENFLKLGLLVLSAFSWHHHFFLVDPPQQLKTARTLLSTYLFSFCLGVISLLKFNKILTPFYLFHKSTSPGYIGSKVVFTFSEPSFVLPHAVGILALMGIYFLLNETKTQQILALSHKLLCLSLLFLIVGGVSGSLNALVGIPVVITSFIVAKSQSKNIRILDFLGIIIASIMASFAILALSSRFGDASSAIRYFRSFAVIKSMLMNHENNQFEFLFGYGYGNLFALTQSSFDTIYQTIPDYMLYLKEIKQIVMLGGFDTTYNLWIDLIAGFGIVGFSVLILPVFFRMPFASSLLILFATLQFSSVPFQGIAFFVAWCYTIHSMRKRVISLV